MYAAIAWERARYAFYARTVKPQLGIPLPADETRLDEPRDRPRHAGGTDPLQLGERTGRRGSGRQAAQDAELVWRDTGAIPFEAHASTDPHAGQTQFGGELRDPPAGLVRLPSRG